MKRVIIVLNMLAMIAVAGNAQFLVEGSVGVRFWGETSSLDGVAKSNSPSHYLLVSPLVGYQLNEKLVLGVSAYLIRYTYRFIYPDPDTGDEVEWERKEPGWGGSVFDRYKLWGTKNFSLLVQSSIYMGEYTRSEKRGTTTTINETRSDIGIHAFPMISYNLSDRFSITFSTDFLSLNLYALTVNDKNTGKQTKTNHFEFNGQTTIINSLSEITIGIIYHFNKKSKK